MRSETAHRLSRLLDHLPGRRVAMAQLLLLSFVPALLDLASVAVIARFTGSLVNTGLEDRLPGIHVFGGNHLNQGIWLLLIFVALAWVSSICKLLLKYFQQRLSTAIWRDLSDRVYANLLLQPYEYHLTKNTADLNVQMLNTVKGVATNVVASSLQIASSSVSIFLLSAGILFFGRWLAVALVVTLVLAYAVVSSSVIPRLRIGYRRRLYYESESISVFNQSLTSVSDIQLAAVEPYFESRFKAAGARSRRYVILTDWLPDLPRGLIEPLGITMIFVVGAMPALISADPSRVEKILPFMATISVAALRLTAPLQDVFRSLTQLRGGMPLVEKLLELLELPATRPTSRTPGVPSAAGVFPRHTVALRDVWYRYPTSDDWVLRGVSLSIPVGSRVALVGATGSGKTTTANLMLGLLSPQRGGLELDGLTADGLDLPAWQSNCAHVPQLISLLNGNVLDNVAFGEPPDCQDRDRAWDALEAAQLLEFVADLPYGLSTPIGENGVRLSGGQRQRLALARAFYRRARFLVLDEATSALDNKTESEVIEALEVIGRRCTTLVVAHRLSTVQRCDRIYEFANGQIKASGTYLQLMERSDTFNNLVSCQQPQPPVTF
jgi:ATP-binding cassette subfamily B protein